MDQMGLGEHAHSGSWSSYGNNSEHIRILALLNERTPSLTQLLSSTQFCIDVGEHSLASGQLKSGAYAILLYATEAQNVSDVAWLEDVLASCPTLTIVLVSSSGALARLPDILRNAVLGNVQPDASLPDMCRTLQWAVDAVGAEESQMSGTRAKVQRILLVEDSQSDATLFRRMLTKADKHGCYELQHVKRLAEVRPSLNQADYDLVVLDLGLPDADGIESVSSLKSSFPSLPIVVMSGSMDENVAAQAVKRGAQDYLLKGDVTPRSLRRSIRYSIERQLSEDRLVHLAHFDQLTGLTNRAAFYKSARKSLARAKRLGYQPTVLVVDLDRFKIINDTMGHHVGDQLLCDVARRLREAVRDSDTVARLGGDEFALLLDGESNGRTPAERVLRTLSAPVSIDGAEVSTSASVGIAVYPENGTTIEELLMNADAAMYRAKEQGRNNYQFFDEAMHEEARDRTRIELSVDGALARQEFSLAYQPLFSCATNAPIGFEALMRWDSPKVGRVSPGVFIKMLEDRGHIVEVGEWVLREACEQTAKWQRHYSKPFRISVNVSARQFDDECFVHKVKQALSYASLPPECLELEVTEGLIMRDVDGAAEKLRALKEVGVRVAIDDFGTGYSQLVYLVRFPIDTLKIDRSVIEMIGSAEGDLLNRTVIDLGHNLGLEVVGEGVEESSQLHFLQQNGCETFQGYLGARPQSKAKTEEWLRLNVDAPVSVSGR